MLMGLGTLKPFSSPGPHGRHLPKNGMTNKKYGEDHNMSTRQASKARRGEKWNPSK
jgi:hypothetical protein